MTRLNPKSEEKEQQTQQEQAEYQTPLTTSDNQCQQDGPQDHGH